MYCPCRRFISKTMRIFSERSSKYHSLMRPLICRAFFVALDLGVGVVSHRDKTDAPDGKQAVNVLLHQLHVTGKTGLALAENDLKLLLLGRFDHLVEVRPQAVGAGIILVAVDVVDVPAALHGVADQQRFLVLDALGFRLLLIFVLLTQSCINRARIVTPPSRRNCSLKS